MQTLILTGWFWKAYPVAAAAVLRALKGAADVRGVSKGRLPEMLEELPPCYKKVIIVGVSLGGDPERMENALKRLNKRNVSVCRISSFPIDAGQQESLSGLLDERVIDCDLLDAVAEVFRVDVSDLKPYAVEAKRVSSAVEKYHELVDAAMYAHRNYQEEEPYAKAIGVLAHGIAEPAWSSDLKKLVAHYRRCKGRELVGKSTTMQRLQERINRVASHSDARVLIIGESGTGKETVALQIHNKSERREERFIAFNCAGIAKELLESRFFGYEKGAFTGADCQRRGLFELANKGTLFLDEIGELPLEAQGTLLRVLEGGRFMRMGGSEEIETDVRLVTATNRNLPAFVREGKFRADLFQRLNVVQLRVPSLREHKEDVRDIADGWWLQHHKRRLGAEQLEALMEYEYPGNVRELLNLLERASVLGEQDFRALLAEHKEMNAGLLDGDSSIAIGGQPDELDIAIESLEGLGRAQGCKKHCAKIPMMFFGRLLGWGMAESHSTSICIASKIGQYVIECALFVVIVIWRRLCFLQERWILSRRRAESRLLRCLASLPVCLLTEIRMPVMLRSQDPIPAASRRGTFPVAGRMAWLHMATQITTLPPTGSFTGRLKARQMRSSARGWAANWSSPAYCTSRPLPETRLRCG